MTWMGEGEQSEEQNLTEIQRVALNQMAEYLDVLAFKIGKEPIDPKVEALLRMAADCLKEQVQLDKYYPWECENCNEEYETKEKKPNSSEKYLLLENKDESPSSDELEAWFKQGDDNGEQQ